MGKRLQITPANVRGGADRIDAENTTVTGLAVPDATAAASALAGLSTSDAITSSRQMVVSSMKAVGGRWARMAQLCRDTANGFEMAELTAPGMLPKTWMSQQIGDGLAGMGDLNPAKPGR